MNADERGFSEGDVVNLSLMAMMHAELTQKIIGVYFDVYNELGFGFLESVCEEAMIIGLQDAGLRVEQQVPIKVHFRGREIGVFFADLLVEGSVILELKCARSIDPTHEAQLLNYLRATSIEVGLILNFGPKPEFKRLVYENARKTQMNPNPKP